MKKRLLILLYLIHLVPFISKAQNLVPNGNFEYFQYCPTFLDACTGWQGYSYNMGDSYDKTCTNSHNIAPCLPVAANGKGYIGLYYIALITGSAEYATRSINPLTVGTTYEASMFVKNVSCNHLATWTNNGLGIFFAKNHPTTGPWPVNVLPLTPQASFASYGPVTDTANWKQVTVYFTADSSYDKILIGYFTPPGGLEIEILNPTKTNTVKGQGYYYIDSVVVKPAPRIICNYSGNSICAGDTFMVPYSIANGGIYGGANTFTVQLSDSSGSFLYNIINIGSLTYHTDSAVKCVVPNSITPGNNYRLRIVSDFPSDTSNTNIQPLRIGISRPQKPIASNNGPICFGDSLVLNAGGSSNLSYKWKIPGNIFIGGQNIVLHDTFLTKSGQYIVTAYSYGCSASDTISVIVNPKPLPVVATSNAPICENDTLKLVSTLSSPGTIYAWSGPNGYTDTARIAMRKNAKMAMVGDYIVTASLGTSCTTKDTVTVSLIKPAAPGFGVISNSPVCEFDTLSISASSSDTGTHYSWKGPLGFSLLKGDTSISNVQITASGKYIVTASYYSCITKDSVDVQVNPSPNNLYILAPSLTCMGDSINLLSNTSSSGVQFYWTGPGNFSSTNQNIVIANAASHHNGKYLLSATLGNCTLTDSTTVNVKPMPPKPVIITDTVLCEGDILHLSADSITPTAAYQWTGPDNFTSAIIAALIFNVKTAASGTYILTANENGCMRSDTAQVLVKVRPEEPIITSNAPLQTGQNLNLNLQNPQSGVKYTWTGPNNFTSYATNPILYTPGINYTGSYIITAYLDGCFNSNQTLVQIDYSTDTGIILLYPSPNNGGFTVRVLLKKDQNADLRIVNSAGQEMYRNTVATKDKVLNTYVDARNRLSSGVYILHLWADDTKYAIPFVVDR